MEEISDLWHIFGLLSTFGVLFLGFYTLFYLKDNIGIFMICTGIFYLFLLEYAWKDLEKSIDELHEFQ